MNNLTFIKNYRDIDTYRRSFNTLTRQTFGFDFEAWYRAGWWGGAYIPYSFADGNRIVANVSVNLMRLVIDGSDVTAIQLGTVMTDQAYRNRGLSRALMNIILSEYEKKSDFIYLFANERVLDFYPKFGFERCTEYDSRAESGKPNDLRRRKLTMDDPGDKVLFLRLIKNALPSAKIASRHDPGLVMFYCSTIYKDCLLYLPELDLAAVAEESGGALNLIEVFSEKPFDLDTVINALADEGTPVTLGFTPLQDGLLLTPKTDPNDVLFIRSKTPLTLPQAMFPLLSKA
jgi:GNAT superfamily N-acetyltransferase